jgi:predicted ATPase
MMQPTQTVVLGSSGPFRVTVIGQVSVCYAEAERTGPLSAAKQRTLAALVAAGSAGIDWETLGLVGSPHKAISKAAVRMAVARLRDHFGPSALPEAVDGRYYLRVPAVDVDAWQLYAHVSESTITSASLVSLRHLLQPIEAYQGIGSSALIDRSVREVRQAQRELFARLAIERPEVMRGDFVDQLSEHIEEDPYNEHLLELAAICLGRTGDRRGALDLIARSRKAFVSIGLPLSQSIDSLELDLLDGRVASSLIETDLSRRDWNLPLELVEQLSSRFVESQFSENAFDELLTSHDYRVKSVVISGTSGVGKTRLCAELARRAHGRGFGVVYAASFLAPDGAAFGALSAALPRLRNDANAIFERLMSPDERKAAMWSAIVDAIATEASSAPLVLIFDDAQWLDSSSAEFLGHLARTQLYQRVILIVTGRPDGEQAARWVHLIRSLRHAGAKEVEVSALDETGVHEIVRQYRPRSSRRETLAIARQLSRVCDGLPGVARLLLDGLVDDRLTLPDIQSLAKNQVVTWVVDGLSEIGRTLGEVGSVLGQNFDLATLMAVSALSQEDTLVGVDELVRRGLFVEHSVIDFALAHILVGAAFLGAGSQSQAARWHLRASDYFSSDIHRRARHQLGAVPLVSAEDAAASLVKSARVQLDAGLYWEAANRFQTAAALHAGGIELADAALHSRALDLAGLTSKAQLVRSSALDAAMAEHNVDAAFAIATSGLPEAEPIDGSKEIVGYLQRLDTSQLSRDLAWRHARTTSRQLAITGDLALAAEHADQARRLAKTADERIGSAIASRLVVSAAVDPWVRLDILDRAERDLPEASIDMKAEYLMLQAIDRYEACDRPGAMATRAKLGGVEQTAPIRRWHSMLFDAMVATDSGDISLAKSRRSEAFEYSMNSGLHEGYLAMLGAEFVDLWIHRKAATLEGLFDDDFLAGQQSVLTHAAAAVVFDECGRSEQAIEHATILARRILASPVSQGTAALAIACNVLSKAKDRPLIEAVRDTLMCRGESVIVVGAGAACLGPAMRYVAQLSSGSDRLRLLSLAKSVAERSGGLLWRSIALRDLLEHKRNPALARELCSITEETELHDSFASVADPV